MSHDAGAVCLCVARHVPKPVEFHVHHVLPLAEGGPDTPANRVWICPTSHVAVHELLRDLDRHEGSLPWGRWNDVNPYVRGLVRDGWTAIVHARTLSASRQATG